MPARDLLSPASPGTGCDVPRHTDAPNTLQPPQSDSPFSVNLVELHLKVGSGEHFRKMKRTGEVNGIGLRSFMEMLHDSFHL